MTVDDRLVLPRGLRHAITAIVERAGSRLDVTDVRNPGREIEVSFTAELSSLPSLARHDDVAELTSGYGQVVVDECHHLAAGAYEHSVKRIGAQFWLGLTATPTRRDGLGEVVTWQLGPIRHTMTQDDQGLLAVDWVRDSGPQRLLYVHETDFQCADVPDLASVHRALAADEARNAQIADDVVAVLGRGRNCLVLTRRVAHLDSLAALLGERGHPALVLQGGMPVAERRATVNRVAEAKAGDGVLVIGTTPFIGEGFDAPALDTLFLAGPISFDGAVDPMRRAGGAGSAGQERGRGTRLPRPGGADHRRFVTALDARIPRTRVRPEVTRPRTHAINPHLPELEDWQSSSDTAG